MQFTTPAEPAREGAGAPWHRACLLTAALKNDFLSINVKKSLDASSK
jgi:hypothetical protein